uniref:Amidase domain-containing protein n=1 Tax=Globodera pallida TaxID=36090 RepID=A0A183C9R0_GLOPA
MAVFRISVRRLLLVQFLWHALLLPISLQNDGVCEKDANCLSKRPEAEVWRLNSEQYPSLNMHRYTFIHRFYPFLRFLADCYFALVDGVFELYNAFQPVQHVNWKNASKLLFIPAQQAAQMIRQRNEVNPLLNAVAHQNFNNALKEAAQLDSQLAKMSASKRNALADSMPLYGVPFTCKDNIWNKGFVTGAGNPYLIRNGLPASDDATVVKRMKTAGAILVAITVLPNLGLSWACDDSGYGIANNPHDTRRITGGSSAGEGALITSGASLCGIGNDIGGSVRIPSNMNGVFGLKPTSYPDHIVTFDGLVPAGLAAYQPAVNLLSNGLLCRYATDLPIALSVRHFLSIFVNFAKNMRLFYLEDLNILISQSLQLEPRNAVRQVKRYFEQKYNSTVQKVEFPLMSRMYELFYVDPWSPGILSFDELKTMFRQIYAGEANATFLQWEFEAMKRFLVPKDDEERNFVAEKKEKLRTQMANLLGQNGVLLTPVWPTSAPFHHMEPFTSFNIQYTLLVNVLGFPALAVPVGKSSSTNMPLGVQLIAAPFNEALLIAVARELERAFGGWVKPGEGPRKHLRLDWHPTRDLLGVCSVLLTDGDGGFATFFTKKGGKPFFTSKIRQGNAPTCFCWHPFEPLLAVGWETGHLNVVDPTKKTDSICGVTSKGRLATWRRIRDSFANARNDGPIPVDQQWKLASAIALNVPNVIGMAWSHTSTAFALNCGDSVQIFLSQGIDFYVDSEFAVIQASAQLLNLVKITHPVETQELQLHSNIRGFYVTGNHLLLWDDAKVQLDQLHCPPGSPLQISHIAAFDVQNVQQAAYHNQHVFSIIADQLFVHTLQGTVKRAIAFREIEGRPELISVKGNWLCVATSLGYLRIYDLTESVMKLTFHSSNLHNAMPTFGKWTLIKLNTAGNRVSFTIQQADDERPYERLFVWEAENDSVGYFSFYDGITDQQQYEADAVGGDHADEGTAAGQRPKTAAIRKIESEKSRFRMPLHLPGNHFWDQHDPRLLVCEASPVSGAVYADSSTSGSLWLTMFVTAEHGIQMHDLHKKPQKADSLLFVSVPHLYFLRNIEVEEEDDPQTELRISRLILRRTMREFVGIDPQDEKAVRAMLDFAFFLCVGQMDNAFKAIKFIRTESVWEHMARMCVKTRRIDVARVCLGHMGHARTARAIRRAVVRGDATELQIARLAVELGMTEEAVGLFQKADRWDEVNRLLQAQGKWPEAIEVAEKHDRIHLRHTHYNYAKYLESVEATEKAIENYEKANAHHFEVPRMLCDQPKALELYIRNKSERELNKWWAHFLESQGDMATAKIYYQSADDFLSMVRIECHNGQVQEAAKIVDQSGSRAAAFHLALHLEAMGDSNGAVHYFGTAGAFSNAIRLAKEHNMVDRLVNLALMAGGAELVEAADFYKDLPGHADKVVMLYHKAGLIGRALDFAFRTGQFGALDLIAQDLNENSDPSVLIRAAEFFSANQQESQAVRLLVHAKKYSEAVKLCSDKNVQITDELDTFLTPNKMESLSSVERCNLLEQIARCSLQQGNYHFAAKKFTQAGNKLEAMRALLKSGDSQRVILFAQTARIGDIYRMAGNYLQSLNWKEDARLMRQIETFYVKAGAMDLLSNFYESCAQVEIDEFHDYKKAAAAYGEALRCLTKKLDEEDGKDKRYLLERREKLGQTLDLIAHFNEIKGLYETDPGESIRQLDELVERTGINEHIRLGDIYALIVAHNFKRENYRKAWQLIEHCEQRLKPRVDMRRFLQRKILDRICDELGIQRMTTGEGDDVGGAEEEGAVEYSHALRRRMRDDEGAPRGRERTDGGGV